MLSRTLRLMSFGIGLSVLFSSALVQAAAGGIEEVVVTAQKRAESVQDVPISVSAFDAQALEDKQIDTFSDLQFNVPNVSYSKGNFTGNNFQIRGIGTALVATSADTGVSMHVNDVYINNPRIFETEYYDMAQVEILRGPQGTLFGRNATGGVVNLKTARPEMGELGGNLEVQAGNYEHRRVKGALNIPLGDRVAGRIAGIYVDRDGYTDNLFTGNDIDDREQWSVRGSLRFELGDATTLDLIGHVFEEESSRTRSQKQFCSPDPSAVLGCLPNGIPTGAVNPVSTLGTLLASDLVLGPLAVFNFADALATYNTNPDLNPDGLRDVSAANDPEYDSEENFLMAELSHDLTETLTLTALLSMQDTEVSSRQDYNGTAPDIGAAVLPTGFCAFSPAACTFFGVSDGGPIPFSTVASGSTSLGAIAGGSEVGFNATGSGKDLSRTEAEQWSGELRIASSFNGPINFLLSGYYLDYEADSDYFVQTPLLDYPSIVLGTDPLGLIGNPAAFGVVAPGMFNSQTDEYTLESLGVFGELYFDINDTMKLTLGLRYTEDEKNVRDRQYLLNIPTVVGVDGSVSVLGASPSVSNVDELIDEAVALGAYDGDVSTPGSQPYREDGDTFDEYTGRLVFDWTPTLDFTDETLVYFSYSRGYKSGGINPPIDTTLFPNTPETFEPETIDAYEIGTKNTFWDRRAQANFSVFYYDYGDYQIGKIINRTSLNENTDAEILGAELEILLAPTENWQFNGQFSYLDTELGDTDTIDPRDPTQGRQDVTLIKDLSDASNCVVAHNGQGAVSSNAAFQAAAAANDVPYIPTGPASGLPATPGVSDSAFSACAGMAALAPAFGYEYLDSVTTNLDGNELQGSPQWTVSLGAQYTHFMGNGMSITGRLDYYWQDEFYTTTFNRSQDLINSWDVWNAQVTLNSRDDTWYLKGFVQNLEDDDNLVGTYQTDPSSGLFTNGFFIEPRLVGATFGVNL